MRMPRGTCNSKRCSEYVSAYTEPAPSAETTSSDSTQPWKRCSAGRSNM